MNEARRLKKLMSLIERVRIDSSLPPFTDRVLIATAASWDEHLVLARVPTERLGDCYLEAMAARAMRNSSGPFIVSELVAAWLVIQERERYQSTTPRNRMLTQDAQGACTKCFGSGWEDVGGGVRRCSCRWAA